MTRGYVVHISSVLAIVTCLTSAVASAEQDSREVQRLIGQLKSADFSVRQRASQALEKLGSDAVEPLAAAAVDSDSEVRGRAVSILLSPGFSNAADARDAVRRALVQLADSPDPQRRNRAMATLARVSEAAATAAAAQLTRQGAVLMPVPGGVPGSYNVQLGASWKGGNNLAALGELVDVPWLSLESSTVGDEVLAHIARLGVKGRGPTKLFLGNSRVSGARLASLAPLKNLTYLSLKQLAVTDNDLAALPDFPELQYLGLDGTRLGNDGLKAVARYAQLQVLWLDNTQITDQGLIHLRSLSNLRTLYLPGTGCSGSGLAALADLPGLTSLSLKGVRLSPDSLQHVGQLERLESLGLDQTNVTDDQLGHLAALTKLQILWLSGTDISDEGLAHLRSLRSLRIVHLSETQVTTDGASELQRSLPGCQVTMAPRSETSSTRPPNLPLPARP